MKKTVLLNCILLIMTAMASAQEKEQEQRGMKLSSTNDITVKYTDKRIALVIGNANYESSRLPNPLHDADTMTAVLRRAGFEVIEGKDLDARQMLTYIHNFGTRLTETHGVGLFYYSGHGLQVNGENYLIPLKANIEKEQDVEFEATNLARALAEMDHADNWLNIVILDACRNNPFSTGLRSQTRGLAMITAPTGTIIAYSTSPGKVAADGTGLNSPYTEAFRSVLRGQTDAELLSVFKNISRVVKEKTANQQIPWISTSVDTDFYFFPKKNIIREDITRVETKKENKTEKKQVQPKQTTTLVSDNGFLKEAMAQMEAKNYTSVVEIIDNGLAEYPASGRAYELKATALKNKGDYAAGFQAALEAIKLYTNQKDLSRMYQIAGSCKRLTSENKDAMEYFNKAVTINPQNGKALWERGSTQYDLNEFESAKSDFLSAIRYYRDKDTTGMLYYSLSKTSNKLGNSDEAMKYCDQGLGVAPKLGMLYWLKGGLYYNAGEYEKGEKAYLGGLPYYKENSDKGEITYWAGECRLKQKDYAAAIKYFNEAITLNPNYQDAYWDRAIAYFYTPDYENSTKEFLNAAKYYSDSESLSKLYFYAGQSADNLKNYDDALKYCRIALTYNHNYGAAYWQAASEYYAKERYDEAGKEYENAAIHYTDRENLGKLYYMVAKCDVRAGNKENAMYYVQKCKDVNPEYFAGLNDDDINSLQVSENRNTVDPKPDRQADSNDNNQSGQESRNASPTPSR